MNRSSLPALIAMAFGSVMIAFLTLTAKERQCRNTITCSVPGVADTTAPALSMRAWSQLDRCTTSERVAFGDVRWVVADSIPGRFVGDYEPGWVVYEGWLADGTRRAVIRRDILRGPDAAPLRMTALRHVLMHARVGVGHDPRYFNAACGTILPGALEGHRR